MTRRPYLIAIAGPSCSGKSELAKWLARELSAPIVSLDSYYRDLPHLPFEQRARTNFDEPEAVDEALILDQIAALAAGRPIDKPAYDFAQHLRAAEVEHIEPSDFVILEGLFALHWEPARRLCGTKVFVEVDDAICFERRLDRDVRERGRTPESVREQYAATVRPMAEKYIYPTHDFADVIVSGVEPIERSGSAVLAHIERHAARPAAASD